MPRSSIMGTVWLDAWGTAGTQSLVPFVDIEGIGSWAEKMDDRMCFLAAQQTDVVFSEEINCTYDLPEGEFRLLQWWNVYYNGYHPQMVLGFNFYNSGGAPLGRPGTFSVRFGDVDFGTWRTTVSGATVVLWSIDIPDSFASGEYKFQIYGASNEWYFLVHMCGPHLTFLPARF